ncbi:unnamed protein product, partial [Mesorhabditis spiculigera]
MGFKPFICFTVLFYYGMGDDPVCTVGQVKNTLSQWLQCKEVAVNGTTSVAWVNQGCVHPIPAAKTYIRLAESETFDELGDKGPRFHFRAQCLKFGSVYKMKFVKCLVGLNKVPLDPGASTTLQETDGKKKVRRAYKCTTAKLNRLTIDEVTKNL